MSKLKNELAKMLPVAVKAAVEAGEFIVSKFGKFKTLESKPDSSWVTEVDKRSEKIISDLIRKKFPSHNFHGEETGLSSAKNKSRFTWHVDPLDGTSNFIHGFPIFCVSIGLDAGDGKPVLGVIYQPMTKDLYTGCLGKGAFWNKKKFTVSKIAKMSDALVSTGFCMNKELFFNDEMKTFSRMAYDTHSIRRTGSAAMDLTYVASGRFDGFWERGLNPWDMAAALAILSEAGGKYTQIDGSAFHLGDHSIVATNGLIHEQMIKQLNGK